MDNMKQVCVVEDSAGDAEQLEKFIRRFAEERKENISVKVYREGIDFLSNYKSDADVVFLDVEMPILSGIDVARKLRDTDPYVQIVFVTNMVQYALRGYEVSALDYVIKPVSYYRIADCLKRAFMRTPAREVKQLVITVSPGETVRVAETDIYYIEKQSNYLIYHTVRGDYRARGSLHVAEDELRGGGNFSRCINGCLVNLRYVDRTTQTSVFVGGTELPLARPRRKDFMNDLLGWLGKGGRA